MSKKLGYRTQNDAFRQQTNLIRNIIITLFRDQSNNTKIEDITHLIANAMQNDVDEDRDHE